MFKKYKFISIYFMYGYELNNINFAVVPYSVQKINTLKKKNKYCIKHLIEKSN